MPTKTSEKDWVNEIGKPAYESVKEMVQRLRHCRECDGERCTLTAQQIFAGINIYAPKRRKATEEEIVQYHNAEEAAQAILDDPLSMQVRSDWHAPGEEAPNGEFELLLGTGGPAVRIVGDLDNNEPSNARLEVQNWSKPWMEYHWTDKEVLLDYCRCFYFGD